MLETQLNINPVGYIQRRAEPTNPTKCVRTANKPRSTASRVVVVVKQCGRACGDWQAIPNQIEWDNNANKHELGWCGLGFGGVFLWFSEQQKKNRRTSSRNKHKPRSDFFESVFFPSLNTSIASRSGGNQRFGTWFRPRRSSVRNRTFCASKPRGRVPRTILNSDLARLPGSDYITFGKFGEKSSCKKAATTSRCNFSPPQCHFIRATFQRYT